MPANGRLSVATGFKAAAEIMSTEVRNCTFRTSPPPYLRGCEERRQAIAQTADKARRTRDLLARRIECPVMTGAGTFEFESASGVDTELQCGSTPHDLTRLTNR
jgi:hypothetical protein